MKSAALLLALALAAGGIASAAAQGASPPPPMQPAAKSVAKPRTTPAAEQPAPAPPPGRRELDLAYGAYQRGYYIRAFSAATRRVEETKDVKAMTLLGELYANGQGVKLDDKKAADWYRLAAERGDR